MEVVCSAVKIKHSFPKESFNSYKKMRKQPKASSHKWRLTDLVLWRYKWVDYHQALAALRRRNHSDLCSNMFHIKFDYKSGRLFSTMHWQANWCESIRRKTKDAREMIGQRNTFKWPTESLSSFLYLQFCAKNKKVFRLLAELFSQCPRSW